MTADLRAPLREPEARKEPVTFTAESVLTITDVARWLQVSKRMAERLNIPAVYLGTRTRRFRGADVLAYLEKRRVA